MAKKVRRVRRKAASEESEEAVSSRILDREAEFQEEYAYVLRDLRRVFFLALVMFALLIVLNILLQ